VAGLRPTGGAGLWGLRLCPRGRDRGPRSGGSGVPAWRGGSGGQLGWAEGAL